MASGIARRRVRTTTTESRDMAAITKTRLIYFREFVEISSKNEREREESRARIDRDRSSQEDRERERARLKEWKRKWYWTMQCREVEQVQKERELLTCGKWLLLCMVFAIKIIKLPRRNNITCKLICNRCVFKSVPDLKPCCETFSQLHRFKKVKQKCNDRRTDNSVRNTNLFIRWSATTMNYIHDRPQESSHVTHVAGTRLVLHVRTLVTSPFLEFTSAVMQERTMIIIRRRRTNNNIVFKSASESLVH